jgi:uncharacterized protein YdiU (UPF0061 family)
MHKCACGCFRSAFRKKLGLHEDMDDADHHLITLLLRLMEETGADFTQTFRQLGEISLTDLTNPEALNKYWSLKKLSSHVDYPAFTEVYLTRITAEKGWSQISYFNSDFEYRYCTKYNFQFKFEEDR